MVAPQPARQPAKPESSAAHIPQFITDVPDPLTGQAMEDYDGDVHGVYFDVIDRVNDTAQVEGDMGRTGRANVNYANKE